MGCEHKKQVFPGQHLVKQLTRDGVLIRVFYGIHEAGRQTNIDYRHIHRVLSGNRKTAGGYKWEYAL